jgi:hypothetical protein
MSRTHWGTLQISLRSFLVTIAVLGLLFVPVASLERQRQHARREREVLLHAREAALRSVVMAERGRAAGEAREERIETTVEQLHVPADERGEVLPPDAAPTRLERLERENAGLKKTVEALRRKVDRLKGGKVQ